MICDGVIFGKPEDAQQAREMLLTLRGRDHDVCTSVTLQTPDAHSITELTCTRVTMRAYHDSINIRFNFFNLEE